MSSRWSVVEIRFIAGLLLIMALLTSAIVCLVGYKKPNNRCVSIHLNSKIHVSHVIKSETDASLVDNYTLRDDESKPARVNASQSFNLVDDGYHTTGNVDDNPTINVDDNPTINVSATQQPTPDDEKMEFTVGEKREHCPKDSSGELDSGCQPRKTFIRWNDVRSYLVRARLAHIPGTWLGKSLEVMRCRDSLDPCGEDGFFCRVSKEEERETEMELRDNQRVVANLTLKYIQDSRCECLSTKFVGDELESPPFIFNATVERF